MMTYHFGLVDNFAQRDTTIYYNMGNTVRFLTMCIVGV